MELYDIFLGICFLIGGLFLIITEDFGTFDWSSVVGSMLITIVLTDIARRSWNGWLAYKALYEA